jgi:hypothetical protein
MMFANAFIGELEKPADKELAAALGRTRRLWDQLVRELAEEHAVTIQEWNSYSKKAGWALRLKRKDRAIVYLSPGRGCFMASFALGDKAVQAALASGLPEPVLRIIREARRYAEGTAVRLEVRTAADVEAVAKLAGVKLAN